MASAPDKTDPSAAKKTARQKEFASKSAARAARTRAREFAIQALYQHLIGQQAHSEIDEFTRGLQGFHKCDSAHFDALFRGCADTGTALDHLIEPHLDRPWLEISPIEHAVMWLGLYELQHCPDVPWKVVINEYVLQAKSFGGTDGFKYVNAILNNLAQQVRAAEVAADMQA
jgi:transcription antitermination protein NusB